MLMHTHLCTHTSEHICTCVGTHALIHTVGLTNMSVQGVGLLSVINHLLSVTVVVRVMGLSTLMARVGTDYT